MNVYCRAQYRIKLRSLAHWRRRLLALTHNKCLKGFHICIKRKSFIET